MATHSSNSKGRRIILKSFYSSSNIYIFEEFVSPNFICKICILFLASLNFFLVLILY